jgi:hypothetical protein
MLSAIVFELLRQVNDLVAGELAPAVGGHLAILGIQANDDVAAEGRASIPKETWALDRRGADDDVAQAVVQVALDRVQVAQAAAQLHGDLAVHLGQDGLDRRFVDRLAGEGPVQVHQVQPSRPGVEPAPRHGRRVLAEGGRNVHVALLQAHALAVFQVDGRYQQHG